MNALVEFLIWMLPDFIRSRIFKDEQLDKRKYGEARFDSKTGKQIFDE